MRAILSLFKMFFAAALHVVLIRFSEDEGIVHNLSIVIVVLDDDTACREEEPLARVRRSVWGVLYADDAGIVSTSADELAKMMTVTVTGFEHQASQFRQRRRRLCCCKHGTVHPGLHRSSSKQQSRSITDNAVSILRRIPDPSKRMLTSWLISIHGSES